MDNENELNKLESESVKSESKTGPLSQTDKDEMLEALDGLCDLRDRYEELFRGWLSRDEAYNDLLQEYPEYLFSPEAEQYGEYMKKAEAFENKARRIRPGVEEIDARLRKRLAVDGVTNEDVDEDIHELITQSKRMLTAYKNVENCCGNAFKKVEDMLQVRNDALLAERDALIAEYKRLKKAGRL